MTHTIKALEQQRLALQEKLDAGKTQADRNRLGQFATSPALALEILQRAATLLPVGEKIHFLDPAIGTGAFYSALRQVSSKKQVAEACGFEIDPHYGKPAARLWKKSGLVLKLTDFTREKPSLRFNLIICNPPYVRHHHLGNGDKAHLQTRTFEASGMKMSGLAGLYCHFLGISHAWMTPGGVAGWLIPSEFMDVNYGQAVKHYLLNKVTLLHIHRFDPNDMQFADALVSSAVVWLRNTPPPRRHAVIFSFGGSLLHPAITREIPATALAHERKWTRFPLADIRSRAGVPTISDFFQIKRGIATGDNSYFILTAKEIRDLGLPMETFCPILPSPRYLPNKEINADKDGLPEIERRLFLLDTDLDEIEIKKRFPALWTYLEKGKTKKIHERYLCRHRAPWYAQESRPPAPIVCTYLGRGDTKRESPFRFILNNSRATVANVYLAMYPTSLLAGVLARDPGLIRRVWKALNEITPDQLLGEGRVYGGGLHKLEPRELANVPVPQLADLLPKEQRPAKQMELITELIA
jgi:hypothetical protein